MTGTSSLGQYFTAGCENEPSKLEISSWVVWTGCTKEGRTPLRYLEARIVK